MSNMEHADNPISYHAWAARPIPLHPNRVWRTYQGGRLIDAWQGEATPVDGPFPEDWVASVVRALNVGRENFPNEGLSLVETAPGAAVFLQEMIDAEPEAFLGRRHVKAYGSHTAFLVKILDASERLTLQVHPDRAFAERHFASSFGKTEAWYVLGGRSDEEGPPCVFLGFKPGVTRKAWRHLFEVQDIDGMLNALHRIEVKTGDVILVRAGMPHAIGKGCFLIEIQEPTDYTLRVERTTPRGEPVPDMACHRGLGFDALFECFDYETYSLDALSESVELKPHTRNCAEGGEWTTLIDQSSTDRFAMDRLTVRTHCVYDKKDEFAVAIVLGGRGVMRWNEGTLLIKRGLCLFLPASLSRMVLECEGTEPLTLLICRPPAEISSQC